MFSDKKSLSFLNGWCNGYIVGMTNYLYKIESSEVESLPFNKNNFYKFYEFIEEKIGDKDTSMYDSIMKYCNGDDEKAFDMYFELFDEFIKIEKISIDILPIDK